VSPLLHACLTCGKPTTGNRCPEHYVPTKAKRNQQLRRAVAASSPVCSCGCGQRATIGNPMVADHILEQVNGGRDTPDNLRPMLLKCNAQRGGSA